MSSFFMWVGNEGFVGHEYLAAEKAWEYQQERIDKLEAEIQRIRTETANDTHPYRRITELECDNVVKKREIEKCEAMLWVAYRKSGSPKEYADWRNWIKEKI